MCYKIHTCHGQGPTDGNIHQGDHRFANITARAATRGPNYIMCNTHECTILATQRLSRWRSRSKPKYRHVYIINTIAHAHQASCIATLCSHDAHPGPICEGHDQRHRGLYKQHPISPKIRRIQPLKRKLSHVTPLSGFNYKFYTSVLH